MTKHLSSPGLARFVAALSIPLLSALSFNAGAQSLVQKWQNTTVTAPTRDLAFNPATSNLLLVTASGTVPKIARYLSSDGTSAGADMDLTDVTGGTYLLSGIATLPDGTVYACNYVPGAQATTPIKIYMWTDESAVPVLAASQGGTLSGTSSARYGANLSAFSAGGKTYLLVSGNMTAAYLAIKTGTTWAWKRLTCDSQVLTPGGTFIDYDAPGFANRLRVVAKSRGSNGKLYNFDPTSASPINLTAAGNTTSMTGGWIYIANGITSHDYDPRTRLLGACTSTLQATPFSYANFIYSTEAGPASPTETSRFDSTAESADSGTAGATAWGSDGRLYSTIPVASVGINAFDVTCFVVAAPADIVGTVGDLSATFTSTFGGSGLAYQWYKGGAPLVDDSKYSGVTNASLTINNLVASDTDDYTITVNGVAASTASATARLSVNAGPTGPKTWTGGGADDNWSTAGNWGGTAPNLAGDSVFFDGNVRTSPVMDAIYGVAALTFNSGASAFSVSSTGGTLTLAGNVTNNSSVEQTLALPLKVVGTQEINTEAGNIVLDGVVSGTGGLTKSGSQTLKLKGAAANTFAGALNVTQGEVTLSKTSGNAIAGAVTVGSGAALSLEASDQIADSSVINLQTGAGTMSLPDGATETIRGFTAGPSNGTNASGKVVLGANAQLTVIPTLTIGYSAVEITAPNPAGTKFTVLSGGAASEVRWTPQNMTNRFEKLEINGGRLRLGHGGNPWNGQDSMLGAVPASFMQDQITINNGHLGFNGADVANKFVVHANRGMTIAGVATNETFANTVFPGKITGTGTLLHNGGFNLELTAANDYVGGTRLREGAVVANNSSSFGPGPIRFQHNLARLASSVGGLTIPNQIDLSAVITNSFGYIEDFTLTGDVDMGDTGTSPHLNVTNPATTVTFNGELTNILGLVKIGAGKVALGRANSYSGNTDVLQGSLLVNNSTGSGTAFGTVTVSAGAALGGSGIVAGPLILNGIISPGASVGTFTTGEQSWNGGGRYVWEINDATGTAGSNPGWDKIVVNGALILYAYADAKFTIDITSLSGSAPGLAANFNNAVNQSWTILTTTGGILGFDPTAFALNTSSFSNVLGAAYFEIAKSVDGNSLVLNLLQRVPAQNFTTTVDGTGAFTGATFTGAPNTSYTVQFTDSLNPINWQTLMTVTTDGIGAGSFADPGPMPSQRYYRISNP